MIRGGPVLAFMKSMRCFLIVFDIQADKRKYVKRRSFMSASIYRDLMDQLGWLSKLEPPELNYETITTEFNGIKFYFMYEEEYDADGLYMYCDYGTLPSSFQDEILERLLESNLLLYGNTAPTYAFNPDEETIVQISRISLSFINVDLLGELMMHASVQAHVWRNNFFLDKDVLNKMKAAA